MIIPGDWRTTDDVLFDERVSDLDSTELYDFCVPRSVQVLDGSAGSSATQPYSYTSCSTSTTQHYAVDLTTELYKYTDTHNLPSEY